MNSVEIKNKIIRHLEFFDESQLEDFYNIFLKFVDSQAETDKSFSLNQKETDGNSKSTDTEGNIGKVEHEQAIRELRSRYKKY